MANCGGWSSCRRPRIFIEMVGCALPAPDRWSRDFIALAGKRAQHYSGCAMLAAPISQGERRRIAAMMAGLSLSMSMQRGVADDRIMARAVMRANEGLAQE